MKQQTVVVIGSVWGDEGKGKVTNYFSDKADLVVRYQGGDNAGHTIIFNNKTYKLHLIPSGIFNPHVKNILGNGLVINPKSLISELNEIKKCGYDFNNLYISDRANVLFDYHIKLDGLHEAELGSKNIGTTKKGIGPCYMDKIARNGIRMCDFISDDFKEIYKEKLAAKNEELKRFNVEPIDFETSYKEYQELANLIKPMVCDTISLIHEEYDKGSKILFEGAQGTLLDIDFGTYPFVTSSSPTSGGVCTGSGIGPKKIDEIIGVTKAYATRVGSGPFPTEMINDEEELGNIIRVKANEFGATTKRARRIGWYDGVIMQYSANINGLTGLSLMLLDILSGLKKIKICDYYTLNGKKLYAPCAKIEDFAKCQPHFVELDGWDEDISNVKSYDELPLNAKKYIKKIEEIVKVPVVMFSVGPDKHQTIVLKEVF